MSATGAQGPTTEGSTQLRWIAPAAPKTGGPAPRNLTNLHPSNYRDDERAHRIRLWDSLNCPLVDHWAAMSSRRPSKYRRYQVGQDHPMTPYSRTRRGDCHRRTWRRIASRGAPADIPSVHDFPPSSEVKMSPVTEMPPMELPPMQAAK